MNDLYSIPADITLAFRVQLMNKFLLLGLMYGFAIPVLYLLVALYMWVSQWVDRVNFLHRLAPPPATQGRLFGIVYKVILPIAILLHVNMACKFFYDICDGSGWTAAESQEESASIDALGICSSSLSGATICTPERLFGPTLREEASQLLNGSVFGEPLSLLCIASNSSGRVSTLCHIQSGGLAEVCGDTSWTSAKVTMSHHASWRHIMSHHESCRIIMHYLL